MKEIKDLPEKLYIEEKIGSSGYNCTDYCNYSEQIAYAPEDLTRADEREKVIREIKEIWKKEIFGRYRGVDFVLNEIFLTKLNSLREAK